MKYTDLFLLIASGLLLHGASGMKHVGWCDVSSIQADSAAHSGCTMIWLPERELALAALQSLASDPRGGNVGRLDITNAGVGEEGARLISEVIVKGSIKELFIRNNQLSDNGVALIGKALGAATSKVESIDVSYNQMKDAGAVAVGHSFGMENSTIEELMVDGNPIGATGATAIAAALGKRPWLVHSLSFKNLETVDASGSGEAPPMDAQEELIFAGLYEKYAVAQCRFNCGWVPCLLTVPLI